MSNIATKARRAQVDILCATLGKVLEAAGVTNGAQLANDLSRTAYREARELEDGTLVRDPYSQVRILAERMIRGVRK